MPATMDRSVSYRIIILRRPDGYLAWAPAFPDLLAREDSARAAYRALKERITKDLSARFAISQPPPRDPVVQTRMFRVDLWYLREKEELR
jgi:hypothetical protein